MAGGLIQLLAQGAQDEFITGQPMITFFKSIYRQYTNFAMETIQQDFDGIPTNSNKVVCTVKRSGDLISDCWLEFRHKRGRRPRLGESFFSCIRSVELDIGGQIVDRHTGDWLRIWSELSLSSEKKHMFDRIVNQTDEMDMSYDPDTNVLSSGSGMMNPELHSTLDTFYIPLQFFFCRSAGLALPLVALQYHEVKIIFEFASYDTYDQIVSVPLDENRPGTQPTETRPVIGHDKSYINIDDYDLEFYVNYIFLDKDERKRFAENSHSMLIEQVQYQTEVLKQSHKLNFNHPVKELIWVIQPEKQGVDTGIIQGGISTEGQPIVGTFERKTGFGYYDFDYDYNATFDKTNFKNPLMNSVSLFVKATLKLNNQDRFKARYADYFRYIQPYQYHTRIPSIPIYVYSFALKPEEHQPSGTCNFSRIDNSFLTFELPVLPSESHTGEKTLKLFAVNYNILKITSGLGGLVFAN